MPLAGLVFGPATSPDPTAGFRTYTPSGQGVGHVYMHIGDAETLSGLIGLARKSRFRDQATMVGAIVDVLGSVAGKAALKKLDDNPNKTEGIWLQGGAALTVAKPWYCYERNGAALKMIFKVSLDMRAHGDALFITSAYPDQFHAGA